MEEKGEPRKPEFMKVRDIAGELNVSIDMAYEIAYSLPFVRCGKAAIRVRRTYFEEWVKRNERKNDPERRTNAWWHNSPDMNRKPQSAGTRRKG